MELLFWPDCLNANLDISYFCLQSNFRIYAYSLYTHVFNLSAVDCGPLPALINGSSYGSLTYFPNSIQFSCDSGFLLRGSSGRSCLPTGLWSGSNTTCEGQLLVEFVFTFSTIPFQLIEPLNSIEYSARRRRTRCIKNVLPEDGTYEKVTSISPKTHQANSAELPLELLHLLAIAKKMAFCHDITAYA